MCRLRRRFLLVRRDDLDAAVSLEGLFSDGELGGLAALSFNRGKAEGEGANGDACTDALDSFCASVVLIPKQRSARRKDPKPRHLIMLT